ncbi:MAG: hypothetical protein WCK69_01170, partial [Candidatus Saccharibacteria bacterium]
MLNLLQKINTDKDNLLVVFYYFFNNIPNALKIIVPKDSSKKIPNKPIKIPTISTTTSPRISERANATTPRAGKVSKPEKGGARKAASE